MAENFLDFKENVKIAFSKVKEEINNLKLAIKDNNDLLLEISKKLIEKEKKMVKSKSRDEIGLENKKENYISTGNNGVVVDRRRPSSTTIDQQQTLINDLINELDQKFKGLTKRELSVFMAIYQLEEESGFSGVTYRDIANRLKLSLSTTKGYVTSLLYKKMPIERQDLISGKSQFFVKKELRGLAVIKKLIELRGSNDKLDRFI